jgi:transposase-like protein
MRAEILVGRELRRRWSADDKLQIVREAFAPGTRVALVAGRVAQSHLRLPVAGGGELCSNLVDEG